MKRIRKANALAALGAFQFRTRHNITPTVTAKEIKEEVSGVVSSGEIRVRLNPSVLEEIDSTTNLIKGLDIAWTDTLEKTPPPKGGLRLGIEAFASPKMILLKDRLSSAAGVATVFVADRSLNPQIDWSWPLRIQIRNFKLATMILILNTFKLDLPFIFHNFFDQLSHDQTIDRSLTIALGDTHNHLTISHPTFINDFRVSRFPLELKRQLDRAHLRGLLGIEEYTVGMMNVKDMQDIGAYRREFYAASRTTEICMAKSLETN
jgi:hypothetical protein